MRNQNSDLPGFEGEYYGSVGKEKKHHQDHFHFHTDLQLRKTGYNSGYEWVKRGQKWLRLKIKENEDG